MSNIVTLINKRQLGKCNKMLRTQETPMGKYPAIQIRYGDLSCPLCNKVFGCWIIRLHDMVDYLPNLDHYYTEFRCSDCLMTGINIINSYVSS